jgi:glycosyltransferase involved in cell wall biosynthesis
MNFFDYNSIINFIKIIEQLKNNFNNLQFIFIGKNKFENKFKELCKELNLEKYINFYSEVSRAEKYYILKSSLIHIIPSNNINNPDFIFDSILAKNIIITQKISNFNEILKHTKTGFLINFNKQELEETINLIFQKKELIQKIKNNLEKKLQEKLSWDNHLQILNTLFKN